MKKQVLVGLMLFFTSILVAQNKKLVGNWKENYHTIADTTSSGDISYREVYPEKEDERWIISIIKEKDDFWVINGSDLKVKFMYAPKTNNYYINPKNWWGIHSDLTVEYDDKNQKVLFIDEETRITMFEFSRK